MNESLQNVDMLDVVANTFLDKIEGLKIDPAQAKETEGLAITVVRRRLLPAALYLIENGHNFPEKKYTPQDLIMEVLTRKEDLKLTPELVGSLQQRYAGAVDWQKEASVIGDPTVTHPLCELSQVIKFHLKDNGKKALAKASII